MRTQKPTGSHISLFQERFFNYILKCFKYFTFMLLKRARNTYVIYI